MYKVMKTFICRGCVNPVTGTGCTSVDIGFNANLELVDKRVVGKNASSKTEFMLTEMETLTHSLNH